jgi:two-component system, LytTR family, sensor kinase
MNKMNIKNSQYFASMSNPWYTKKWVAVSLHVLCWILFFAFPFLLRSVADDDNRRPESLNRYGFYYLHFADNILRVLLFYANAYLFIPRMIYRGKIVQYAVLLLLSMAVLLGFNWVFFNLFIEGLEYKPWNFLLFHLPVFIFIIIASTAFRVIRDRIEETQRKKERETESLKTELSFLRSQVSPHFMFNVLNNMVALARKKSDALEPSLIKLSQLLRYMLYETDEDKVSLEKEVEYLQSYIDLQKQRFGKNVIINARFELKESVYSIEPMLLVPFVENAFKHGTGLIPDAEIDIHLAIQNNVLTFSVRNRYKEKEIETKDKTSGIGLNNVKRRLDLLYHDNHTLRIDKKDGWFVVVLQLNLH